MSIITIIWLAIGLAMDCMTVSFSKGIITRRFYPKQALIMGAMFGLFQGGMPLISFYIGCWFSDFIAQFDHWVALGLLGLIGGKTIYDSLAKPQSGDEGNTPTVHASQHYYTPIELLTLSVATSIDALATGILFVSSPQSMAIGAGIIALTSLILSIVGVKLGTVIGKKLRFDANLIGGVILILIGLKIWVEHMFLT